MIYNKREENDRNNEARKQQYYQELHDNIKIMEEKKRQAVDNRADIRYEMQQKIQRL